ncbi:MAG TPA: hypothetical protein VIH90_04360 [Candidatus Saccharimonadales bacterium]
MSPEHFVLNARDPDHDPIIEAARLAGQRLREEGRSLIVGVDQEVVILEPDDTRYWDGFTKPETAE